jgi:hypothetical protein
MNVKELGRSFLKERSFHVPSMNCPAVLAGSRIPVAAFAF